MQCTTCGMRLETEGGWVEFSCPKCKGEAIFRCSRCKRLENTYICKKCGFEGP